MAGFLMFLALLAAGAPRAVVVDVDPPKPRQGQLVVIELSGTRPGDRVAGTFDGRRLRFYVDQAGRIRALAAVPLRQRPGIVSLVVQVTPTGEDPVISGSTVEVRAGDFDKQELSVDPRFVKAPPEVKDRIRRERRAMKLLWKRPVTKRSWRGPFVWPHRDRISSAFGLRRVFNGKLRGRHWGVDIDGKFGQPVRAIGSGTVVMVSKRYYSGGTVVIDHGLRLFSLYFHMSSFLVHEGQRVEKGQQIGKIGSSGRVTGPHLHLSVKLEGVTFDPLSLLGADLSEDGGRGH